MLFALEVSDKVVYVAAENGVFEALEMNREVRVQYIRSGCRNYL